MTLFDRYINGETEAVYADIERLGQKAFDAENSTDVKKVLNETFERVRFNLETIYGYLLEINYCFKTKFKYNFERPLIKPLPETEQLLIRLEKSLNEFGFIPESIKTFYRIVGACNFAWDYNSNNDLIWNEADPIQIASLDDLLAEMTDSDYMEHSRERFEEEGYIALPLSADYFHKDNISGGPPYSLQLTDTPSIDGNFLNEENNTTFINYLRICFESCGFPRITKSENEEAYKTFFDKVKPKLKKI